MGNLWILDNGHGRGTPGKRSPVWSDGSQLFEWEFNRDIVRRIAYTFDKRDDIRYHILVPEDEDISLSGRVERVNDIYQTNAKSILVSIHGNAGGGRGWEVWTHPTPGKISVSDKIAACFFGMVKEDFPEMVMRIGESEESPAKESNLKILRSTYCPAILTENFFYDNEEECRLMMTSEFRQRIANAHIKAILKIEGIL